MQIIRFYVGTGFDRNGTPLDAEFVLRAEREALGHFARCFGGSTMYPTQGSWANSRGELVVEPGLCFEIMTDGAGNLAAMQFHAQYLRDLFCQRSVGYAISEAVGGFVEAQITE